MFCCLPFLTGAQQDQRSSVRLTLLDDEWEISTSQLAACCECGPSRHQQPLAYSRDLFGPESFTAINAINNEGTTTGSYIGSDDRVHGFVLKAGHFSTFSHPGVNWTEGTAINNKGLILGSYETSLPLGEANLLWRNGTHKNLNLNQNAHQREATGLNDLNTLVGLLVPNNNPDSIEGFKAVCSDLF